MSSIMNEFVFLHIGFIAQALALMYFGTTADIKKNWGKYRCNPVYMLFPPNGDAEANLTYCIQNAHGSVINILTQPLQTMMSSLNDVGGMHMLNINSMRTAFASTKNFMAAGLGSLSNKIGNTMAVFKKKTAKLEDMFGKLEGSAYAILHIVQSMGMGAESLAETSLAKALGA